MYKGLTQEGWNELYRKGQHWEGKDHSKQMDKFITYLKKGDKVLDVGCGSGRDSIFLAEQGFEVWGIDFSEEAIRKAELKCNKDNLHFSVQDACLLNFENDFFDAIYSGWTLEAVPLEKSVSEIYRVLRKYGIAYLVLHTNRKSVAGELIESYHSKQKIIDACKKFKILYQEDLFLDDSYDKEDPHMHDAFLIVLRK